MAFHIQGRTSSFFFSVAATLRVQSARWLWPSSPVPPCCCRVWCVAGLPLATHFILLSAEAGLSAVCFWPSGLQDSSCRLVMVPASFDWTCGHWVGCGPCIISWPQPAATGWGSGSHPSRCIAPRLLWWGSSFLGRWRYCADSLVCVSHLCPPSCCAVSCIVAWFVCLIFVLLPVVQTAWFVCLIYVLLPVVQSAVLLPGLCVSSLSSFLLCRQLCHCLVCVSHPCPLCCAVSFIVAWFLCLIFVLLPVVQSAVSLPGLCVAESAAMLTISPNRLREISDPILQMLHQLHKIIFITQVQP